MERAQQGLLSVIIPRPPRWLEKGVTYPNACGRLWFDPSLVKQEHLGVELIKCKKLKEHNRIERLSVYVDDSREEFGYAFLHRRFLSTSYAELDPIEMQVSCIVCSCISDYTTPEKEWII